jgi:hypothetical protein
MCRRKKFQTLNYKENKENITKWASICLAYGTVSVVSIGKCTELQGILVSPRVLVVLTRAGGLPPIIPNELCR